MLRPRSPVLSDHSTATATSAGTGLLGGGVGRRARLREPDALGAVEDDRAAGAFLGTLNFLRGGGWASEDVLSVRGWSRGAIGTRCRSIRFQAEIGRPEGADSPRSRYHEPNERCWLKSSRSDDEAESEG